MGSEQALKDSRLSAIAQDGNVAQFVSFDSRLLQRHSAVSGFDIDHQFPDVGTAVRSLLARSVSHTVNIRTFDPYQPRKSAPFHYGLNRIDAIEERLRAESAEGFFTIVNETIDIHDGGVSGVSLGGIVEFSPDDTPRCVEKPGTASLPKSLADRMFQIVYGSHVSTVDAFTDSRVEFSIHPLRQGYRHKHIVYWEVEDADPLVLESAIKWPNNFSKKIGDKVYGLLVAHLFGLAVPFTTVIPRQVAPFSFGVDTGSAEVWTRTCPFIQMPGKFTTTRGWIDPYALLAEEDTRGTSIASVLAQASVDAAYSGATVPIAHSSRTDVEGVPGFGDRFMVGEVGAGSLPTAVVFAVERVVQEAERMLDDRVRIEWAYDGSQVWVLQLHRAKRRSRLGVIVRGSPRNWVVFTASEGVTALEELITVLLDHNDVGILLSGEVGVTSHLGDLLRRAGIPSRLHGEGMGVQQDLFGPSGRTLGGREVIAGNV